MKKPFFVRKTFDPISKKEVIFENQNYTSSQTLSNIKQVGFSIINDMYRISITLNGSNKTNNGFESVSAILKEVGILQEPCLSIPVNDQHPLQEMAVMVEVTPADFNDLVSKLASKNVVPYCSQESLEMDFPSMPGVVSGALGLFKNETTEWKRDLPVVAGQYFPLRHVGKTAFLLSEMGKNLVENNPFSHPDQEKNTNNVPLLSKIDCEDHPQFKDNAQKLRKIFEWVDDQKDKNDQKLPNSFSSGLTGRRMG